MYAAVIPAAGSGTRFRAESGALPKQYRLLSGAPVFQWSLTALAEHRDIQQIVLAVSKDMLETAENCISEMPEGARQKIGLTLGGATRQESVYLGLQKLSDSSHAAPQFVLIHDAARPFLTKKMIDATIKSVTECGACTLAIPVTDTIKRVANGKIEETLDRSTLFLIQTPQAGRFDWLLEAHRKAAAERFATTDDAAILEYAGRQVSIVHGSRYNLKITNAEDLSISEVLAPLILSGSDIDRSSI